MSASEFSRTPVNDFLGFELLEHSERHAVVRLPMRTVFLQEGGVVQGGILSALADTAGVYVFLPELEPERTMVGVEFKLSFLRPAAAGAGELLARAERVRRGRTLGVARVTLKQAGNEVARGLFTYLFGPAVPGSAAAPGGAPPPGSG